ncbi:MAG: 2-hydroxyacyl-CoA dehydratase [Deltaproteobacteria bacterium]|nr:2-hydroxyacyl-CoA dehydratase [Deltaproteobacteria bacterium]
MRQPAPFAPGAKVGLTTTIPVEVVLAAGLTPVDLNNLFIADPLALARVSQAEAAGFPRTLCAWIKGIYAALQAHPEIQTVIAACQGDCSNTQALGEILAAEGIEVIHFKFPYPRDREQLAREISALMDRLGADPGAVARMQARLTPVRRQLRRLDRLTWETGQVNGRENFQWLISSSDFASDLTAYEQRLTAFLKEAAQRPPAADGRVRLGFAGIPPILTDLWPYLEELGAAVVFHEFPRQFSMPDASPDLVAQYLRYTYPYDIGGRLADLKEAVATRRLDGLVHYTQSFCFRQMFDQFLRDHLNVPLLTIEGDRPTALDSRTRMRLEAFVDVLRP